MGNARKRGIATIAIIVGVSLLCAAIGIVSSKYLGSDNPVEQGMEAIIKDESGLSVDLSPDNG